MLIPLFIEKMGDSKFNDAISKIIESLCGQVSPKIIVLNLIQ